MNKSLQTAGNVSLQVSRYLFGAVFVFSGFVKAIDPMGFSFKIEEYLRTFGGYFESLADYGLVVAIILTTLELLIGLNLIFKIHFNSTSVLALLFMLVYTPLTLYIAIKNPVTDCGCFGDALIISNWATFAKNAALFTILILMLIYSSKITPWFSKKNQYILAGVFVFVSISLSVYSYRHLPMFDFLPYKVGVNIPKEMEIPENAPKDQFETTFIYEREGEQREFTLQNYPKDDSTWIFVEQKSKLIKKGFMPKIQDFKIENGLMDDITQEVLSYPGKTDLLIMYDVDDASKEGAKKAEIFYQNALKKGEKFYALTSSSDIEIQKFVKKTGVSFPFWKTDITALKSIIRANPGIIVVQKGTILKKMNWRDFE